MKNTVQVIHWKMFKYDTLSTLLTSCKITSINIKHLCAKIHILS